MFNVGGMELLVIALVALVVLGPDKLPGAMRQLGSTMGELRRISRGFQTDLRSALSEAERDAERQRRAAEDATRASAPATNQDAGTAPDPGAAMAAAQAELDAIEGATARDDDPDHEPRATDPDDEA
jgi:sec-independent protein translocase protein TatB